MIQNTNQINRRGKLLGGWRFGAQAGLSIDGHRVYTGVRESYSRKYPKGTQAFVAMKGTARVVDPRWIVPENMLGAFRSWTAMLRRCLCKKTNGSYVPKGIEVYGPWMPQFHDGGYVGMMAAFFEFFRFMGPRESGEDLDRINSLNNYIPGNVQWLEKSMHRSKTRDDVMMRAREAAEACITGTIVDDFGPRIPRG